MYGRYNKYKGVFLVELVTGFAILSTLLLCVAISLHGFAKINLFQSVRMQCVAAAQAQLDSFSTTSQFVSENDFKRLWPKIDIVIEQSEGTGQWEGLQLIRVITSGMSYNTPVKVELSRYIESPITKEEQ